MTPAGDTRQCSGAGECVCGQCVCKEEQGARYSGKYCEDCPVSGDAGTGSAGSGVERLSRSAPVAAGGGLGWR